MNVAKLRIKTVFKAIDKMSKPLGKMQVRVRRFTDRMKRGLKGINKVSDKLVSGFGKVAKGAAKLAVGGVAALGLGVGYLVKQFSKVEDVQAAFTPLMGGAEKAKKMVDALNETAASTPFQLETLSNATKQILPTMEGDIENTVKTLRMLGDTAGGNSVRFERVADAYSKMAIKGKAYMGALGSMANAGIPIYTELAKSMGTVADDKFFKRISAGKVSIEDVNKAFAQMTGEGGIFFKGMEIASKTTSGIFSTLKDNVELTAASLGEVLAPVIKDLMTKMIGVAGKAREWIANNQELIKSKVAEFIEKVKSGIEKLVENISKLIENTNAIDNFFKVIEAVGGAIKWLVDNGKTIAIVIGIIGSLILIGKALIGVLTVINLVMAANPVVLIVLAVIALIAVLATLFVKFKIFNHLMGWLAEFPGVVGDAFNWLGELFVKIWDGIVDTVKSAVDKVLDFAKPAIDAAKGIAGFFGFGGGSEGAGQGGGGQSKVVTSEQKTARMIQETRKSSMSEVTIKDETGRAVWSSGNQGQGVTLQRTGSF